MSELRPDYYKGTDGKDLFDRFEAGLLSADEVRGFYKGNAIKYITRYQVKSGTDDLEKAITYLKELEGFEADVQAKPVINQLQNSKQETVEGLK